MTDQERAADAAMAIVKYLVPPSEQRPDDFLQTATTLLEAFAAIREEQADSMGAWLAAAEKEVERLKMVLIVETRCQDCGGNGTMTTEAGFEPCDVCEGTGHYFYTSAEARDTLKAYDESTTGPAATKEGEDG